MKQPSHYFASFFGDGQTERPSRHFIGEFQNRSGLGTGAKRVSCEENFPPCGQKDIVQEEPRARMIDASERAAYQILLRTHRTIS